MIAYLEMTGGERDGVGFWFTRVKYICQLYKVPPNLVWRNFFTLAFI